MSVFSRINTELSAVKKIASVAHIGNGISIDAAKSLISKQLSSATGGITSQISGAVAGATSSISGAVAGATKTVGSITSSISKVSGSTLTSGVLPGPIKR